MAKLSDVLGFLKKTAPAIAAVIGGPAAGAAVAAIEQVFGIEPDPTVPLEKRKDHIADKIEGATADQLAAIRKADQEFEIKMKELDFKNVQEMEALSVQDRQSARQREVALRDWTPRVLAFVTVSVCFASYWYLITREPKPNVDMSLIMLVVGALTANLTQVMSFYFGSTNAEARSKERESNGK